MTEYTETTRASLKAGDDVRVTFSDGSTLVGTASFAGWNGPEVLLTARFGDIRIVEGTKFERAIVPLPDKDGRYIDKDGDWWVRSHSEWSYIGARGDILVNPDATVATYAPFTKYES